MMILALPGQARAGRLFGVRSAAILLAALAVTGALSAQTASFDVASVKPNVSPPASMFIQLQPPGGVVIQNMPLRSIIEWAYQLQRDDDRLVGGPDWIASDPNGAGMLTALREQLGLRLESTRGPVDVLVIDRVERPTPD